MVYVNVNDNNDAAFTLSFSLSRFELNNTLVDYAMNPRVVGHRECVNFNWNQKLMIDDKNCLHSNWHLKVFEN